MFSKRKERAEALVAQWYNCINIYALAEGREFDPWGRAEPLPIPLPSGCVSMTQKKKIKKRKEREGKK